MIKTILRKLKVVRRPQISMPLLTFAIIAGWMLYTIAPAALSYDTIRAEQNLLSNPSFEQWEGNTPKDWVISHPDSASAETLRVEGFIDGSGLRLDIVDYKGGNIVLTSPNVKVDTNTEYFFKSFYETDTFLDLMLITTNQDGSTEQKILRNYPDYDYPWSSMGSLISTDNDDSYVKIAISFSSVGYAEFDSTFLVKNGPITQLKTSTPNLLSLTNWTFNGSDDFNGTANDTDGMRSIEVESRDANSSNTAWLPDVTGVQPNELYNLQITYSSTTPVEIGVDYDLSDGTAIYRSLRQLLPVDDLTNVEVPIEIPKDAVAMRPSVQIGQVGTLTTGNFILNRVSAPATFDAPRVSITFDDGILSSFTNGEHVLDEFGYKATFYINPGASNTDGFMTTAMLKQLLQQGHQLGSHTEDHIDLTSYSPESVVKQLDDADNALRALGVNDIDFASPYGKVDQRVLPYVMQRSLTHRGTEIGVNTKQNYNPSMLMGLFVRNTTTDDELRRMIQQAQDSNGWLILIYHQIESTPGAFTVDTQTLRHQLQIIKDSGVQVETVRKAASELESQR